MSKQLATLALAASLLAGVAECSAPARQLNGHALRLDSGGEIVTWMERSGAMDRMVTAALGFMQSSAPVAPNGLKAFYTYPVGATLPAACRLPPATPLRPCASVGRARSML